MCWVAHLACAPLQVSDSEARARLPGIGASITGPDSPDISCSWLPKGGAIAHRSGRTAATARHRLLSLRLSLGGQNGFFKSLGK